jgi:hypothetical protein
MPNPLKITKNTTIYALLDSTDNKIKYIGKTVKSLPARLADHIYEVKRENNIRTKWIKSLLEKELKPNIIEIDSCTWRGSKTKEIYWIRKMSRKYKLLNKHYNEKI